MNDDERRILSGFTGKTLAGFAQEPNQGNFEQGDWQDDEPLLLTFTDGSVLSIMPLGWHQSGSLVVEALQNVAVASDRFDT